MPFWLGKLEILEYIKVVCWIGWSYWFVVKEKGLEDRSKMAKGIDREGE
jgi:uncharacterized membrane protein